MSPEQAVPAYPDSPQSIASSTTSNIRATTAMPRTSSIDSAISSISNSSWSQKHPTDPTPDEIHNLIATAGSAENLIQHLLRDKSHAASQNAQLWKLVDKQRALLLGLNKDLERLTKERDRYRRKVKELQTGASTTTVGEPLRLDNHSPGPRQDASGIGSLENATTLGEVQATPERKTASDMPSSPLDPAMMPSPLQTLQQRAQGAAAFANPVPVLNVQPAEMDMARRESEAQPRPPPPKQQSAEMGLSQPTFTLTEATPLVEKPPKPFPPNRKAPPKPLDLRQTKEEVPISKTVDTSEAVDDSLDAEDRGPVARGRRKTREEDDRDRELAAIREQEARSRSKKEKRPKDDAPAESSEHQVEKSNEADSGSISSLSQPPPSAHDRLSPPLAGQTSNWKHGQSGPDRLLSLPLRSPGLPASPRPIDRPIGSPMPAFMKDGHPAINSLPMSPRTPSGNFPLSPRAPKQPLPIPTTAADLQKRTISSPLSQMNIKPESDRLLVPNDSSMSPSDVPTVNRGLVSPTWPDLLLPPNALPSIEVKVASSRLRPARNSILGLKSQDDSSVFSLSIFSRAGSVELWRVEKIPASLPHLDQQLRPRCADLPKLPDRKLFSGQSPAVIDARRSAINTYFSDLLDTPVDEEAAVIICRFLSTDVMDPQLASRAHAAGQGNHGPGVPQNNGGGRPKKSGYLTKKGKNFGGWKSRYFVLDSPELRYFEAPGGAHLGTIKLLNAQIGRQTQNDPAGQPEIEAESQYRHAFVILEPKRKDLTSHVRHVLCAESDAERDEWVDTLWYYIDEKFSTSNPPGNTGDNQIPGNDARAKMMSPTSPMNGDSLLKMYNGSPVAPPPQPPSDSPSPSNASSGQTDYGTLEPQPSGSKTLNISGPMNGSVISDAGLWGNKPSNILNNKEREQKKRNLFHFRKSSHEHLSNAQHGADKVENHTPAGVRTTARSGHVRPVFGMSLAEAVDQCPPEDVNVHLPAVVYRCIEYLREKNAANEEGLFRLSGSNLVIRTLKERFNTEGDVDLLAEDDDYDVHAVASLFKTYLRELPSTILTRELHIEFLKVLELDDKSQKVAAFNTLVHQLPLVNYSLLRTLSQYLLEVVQNSDKNKMSVKNVGIVFSPTLNIPAPVFSMFLTDFSSIFDQPPPESPRVHSIESERAGALTPEDIRSPRRQMFSDLPTPSYNNTSFSKNAPGRGVANNNNTAPAEYMLDASNEFGFAPMQPSYESRNYVSIPQEMPLPPPRHPAPPPPSNGNKYGSMNNMMSPENATSAKGKRRESSMLFMA